MAESGLKLARGCQAAEEDFGASLHLLQQMTDRICTSLGQDQRLSHQLDCLTRRLQALGCFGAGRKSD